MAYLDNTVITVDAVLTKLGRERLSQGGAFFNITKWAVSDDEIDYSLYNTAHPLGSDYYSNIIESMPVLEAIPDETQALRYKLYTAENLSALPYLNTINSIATLALNSSKTESDPILPKTENFSEGENYVITLFNEDAATLEGTFVANELTSVQTMISDAGNTRLTGPKNISGTLVKTLQGGQSFVIKPKDVRSSITTKIRITGEKTGVTQTLSFTVDPRQT